MTFATPDLIERALARIKQIAKAPVMVDLRNVYDPAEMRAAGFTYVSVGRP